MDVTPSAAQNGGSLYLKQQMKYTKFSLCSQNLKSVMCLKPNEYNISIFFFY